MPNYQAILFDLDETLLDRTQSLIHYCHWQASNCFKLNTETTKHFVERFIQLDANGSVWKDQVYTQLKLEFKIDQSIDELVAIYLDQFQNFCLPNPEVVETIQKLHQLGFKLGLVSNGKTPFQENNFHSLGLSHYFSSIIVSEAVKLRKPAPEIFLLACQQLKVNAEQCIFVGDNEIADVQGSAQVGMCSVLYQKTILPKHSIAQFTIRHFSELLQIIQSYNTHI